MRTDESLYLRVARQIEELIAVQEMAVGTRLPSIQALCTHFGVSHATIRASLALLVNEGIVQTRERQGVFVAPRRPVEGVREAARDDMTAWPARRERVLALLLSGRESPYEAAMIRGVMEEGRRQDYQVIVASNDGDAAMEARQMSELANLVSGLIIFPTHASGNYGAYAQLLERGVPWVFIDRQVQGLAASLVATDNERGGFLGTSYLLEQGYCEIYVISGKPVSSIQERIQGYKRALKAHGLQPDERLIRSSPHYLHIAGYSLTREILEERRLAGLPLAGFALFPVDETIAQTCYAALREARLTIPDDVAVLGYDDLNARFFDPPLSAVRQEPQRQGVEAVRLLVEHIRKGANGTSGAGGVMKPREIRLAPTLVERHSTQPGRALSWKDYLEDPEPLEVTQP